MFIKPWLSAMSLTCNFGNSINPVTSKSYLGTNFFFFLSDFLNWYIPNEIIIHPIMAPIIAPIGEIVLSPLELSPLGLPPLELLDLELLDLS